MRDRAGALDAGPLDAGTDAEADAALDAGAACPTTSHDVTSVPVLAVLGDPGDAPLGFGDPSIAYAAGASEGFMTYTAVRIGGAETRIARSVDRGASWSFVQSIAPVTPLSLTTTDRGLCGADRCDGQLLHETSSLVDDPTDPDPTRRFKVFVHSYFTTSAGTQRYDIGSIDLYTTDAPGPSATWAAERLFGWASASPYSSAGVTIDVTTDPVLSPSLGRCNVLSEPGALVHDGTIELALGCLRIELSSRIGASTSGEARAKFANWHAAVQHPLLSSDALSAAVRYYRNRWGALTRFIDDASCRSTTPPRARVPELREGPSQHALCPQHRGTTRACRSASSRPVADRCAGRGVHSVGVRAARHASREVRPRARADHAGRLRRHARLTAAAPVARAEHVRVTARLTGY